MKVVYVYICFPNLYAFVNNPFYLSAAFHLYPHIHQPAPFPYHEIQYSLLVQTGSKTPLVQKSKKIIRRGHK